MKDQLMKLDPLSRRTFVEKVAKTALGVSIIPVMGSDKVFGATGGKAKHCIYLYMSGGMTHIDTFDPKPGTETGGKTEAVKTSVPGISLGQYLPGLAERMKDIAVVRTLTQKTADHRGASYWMHTSYQPRATIIHPTLGPWAQKLLGKSHETLPSSVQIGGGGGGPGSGFFGPELSPLPIGSAESGVQDSKAVVDEKSFDKRLKMMQTFDTGFESKFKNDDVKAYTQFYDETLKLMKSTDLDVFDLSKDPKVAERTTKYGNNGFGKGLMLAKNLVKSGVRFVEVDLGGWDMHNDLWNTTIIGARGNTLDTAVSALIDELKADGLFEETLIVLTTEFGRTPNINSNGGRDHYPRTFSGLLAGGGIVGGQVYGKTDAKGIAVEENPVEPKDFNATIATALGLPLDKIVFSPSGRPFMVAGHKEDPATKKIIPEGKVLPGLLS